jgi:hypothetical protein
VLVKGTTSGTGGTFTAGSVFWVVTATDGEGNETVKSNEVTAVMAATSSQALSWAVVPGATGYKIYRGTATGVYNKRVVAISDGATVTYSDLGNAGTSASPPVTGTSTDAVKEYAKGDVIPNATVKNLKNASALLSRRWIIPNFDPFFRKTKLTTPTPTDVSSNTRKAL